MLSTSWDGFQDAAGAITDYQFSIGTKPGASDIAGPFDAGDGLADYYTAVQLHLTVGTTYYVTVTAYDSKLNESVSATSPGVTVISPPTAGTVYDGAVAGVETSAQISTTSLSANWTGFGDLVTGDTLTYSWTIGTTPGGDDILMPTPISESGYDASYHPLYATGLDLAVGTKYYVTVTATDAEYGLSASATSSGVTVISALTAGVVYDGTAKDGTEEPTQTLTTSLSANWTDFSDLVTGDTLTYSWTIGTTPDGDDILMPTPISESGYDASYHPLYATGLDLAVGTKYYVTVTATDAALGESVHATSSGVTVISELTAGVVYDGTAKDGTEEPTQTSTTSLSANWTGFSDLVTGDTLTYSWTIGTTPGGDDILMPTPISESGYDASYHPLYATGLDLAVGTKYYVTVTATDAALGESVHATSSGVTVISELTAGVVYDGTAKDGTEEPTQTSTTSLSANWTGFSDLVTGDTLTYSWTIGTTPGGDDILMPTPISESGYDVGYHPLYATGLDLAVGTKYYVTVTATDAALGESVHATSSGVTVISALTAGVVYDGTAKDGTEEPTQTSTTSLSANWTGFSDLVTGDTLTYSWTIGTTPDGDDILMPTPVSESGYDASYHPLYATGLDLAVGTKYYVTVTATDAALGESVHATSSGVTVISRLTAGVVYDGAVVGVETPAQTLTTSLAANWAGFTDLDSSLVYQWSIGTRPGASDVFGPASVGPATSASATGLKLTQGERYYITVTATDQYGLAVAATSPGVVVSLAPWRSRSVRQTPTACTVRGPSSRSRSTITSRSWSRASRPAPQRWGRGDLSLGQRDRRPDVRGDGQARRDHLSIPSI